MPIYQTRKKPARKKIIFGSKTTKNPVQAKSSLAHLPRPLLSKLTINTYQEAKQFLQQYGISISTMTINCTLWTKVDIDTFARNVILRLDEIVSVKFGNPTDPSTNRTIVVIKSKKKPSKTNFYNQVTIHMRPTNNPKHSYMNIKVFKNGSLQITGCKNMEDFQNVTSTLTEILKRGRTDNDIHIKFIRHPDRISITNIKIRMINSNFELDYKIDRKNLVRLLAKNHGKYTKDTDIGYVKFKYRPSGRHSCVNIKYYCDDGKKTSIFVFQTGAVIITGAKNLHHIIKAYHYISKILVRYYREIRIVTLDPIQVQAELVKFYRAKQNQLNI